MVKLKQVTCGFFGILINILSFIWIYRQLEWLKTNPPINASSGAVGAFFLFTFLPLIFSWYLIFKAGTMED